MYSGLFDDKLRVMSKYEKHFGLSKPPFAAHAAGSDVFVAPQVAAVMAGLKKALATEDSIVSVSGPVGSGKTTIARRALDGIGRHRGIVTIGRIQFGTDEILELLLAGLGVRQLPKSTVHRFATFRRVLQQFAEQQTRVFILVEDATRIGFDALSELEAVTAADAGVSNGANLVLLGDSSLNDLLREPKMARIKQRLRSRQTIQAQSQGELLGYLKHCFRLAGKEYDTIFSDDCVSTLHGLTDGLPRVVNNLVTATLAAAAEQDMSQIYPDLIERIASEEFGLTGGHKVSEIKTAIEKVAAAEAFAAQAPRAEPVSEPALEIPKPEPAPEVPPPEPAPEVPAPEPEPEIPAAEPGPEIPELEPATEPAAPPSAHEILTVEEEDFIPELIQDTLPDLQILAPELLPDEITPEAVHEPTEYELPILTGLFPQAAAAADVPEPEPAPEPEPEPEPETISLAPAEASDAIAEIPAWERDPTLAQLRPDLEALEQAMATEQGGDEDEDVSVLAENIANADQQTPIKAVKVEQDIPEVFPEITLDKQIQAKIEEATEALKQSQIDATADISEVSGAASSKESAATGHSMLDMPAVAPAASIPKRSSQGAARADQELEKIASELAKAKTIEDVDDKLAETLFGEEFSMIAAQVAANAPSIMDETEVATGTPAGETMGSIALSLEEDEPAINAADHPDAPPSESQPLPVDTSASQRLQVLRDLNHTAAPPGAPSLPDATETIVMSGGGVELPPSENKKSVDSIEDQINTSMTQTLKALNINHVPPPQFDDDDDDDEEEEKKGFFSRFRRK